MIFEGVMLISSKKGTLFTHHGGRNFVVIDPSLRITDISDMKYYQNLVKITTSKVCIIFSASSNSEKVQLSEALKKCRADVEEVEEE